MTVHHALNWFEIPVNDMNRASQFYGAVLKQPLTKQVFGLNELMVFAYEQPGVGGCLIQHPLYQPSLQGAVVYLSITDNLADALKRASDAGGRISLGRTELPEGMGCYAHIIDTEGNRVGLHAAH